MRKTAPAPNAFRMDADAYGDGNGIAIAIAIPIGSVEAMRLPGSRLSEKGIGRGKLAKLPRQGLLQKI